MLVHNKTLTWLHGKTDQEKHVLMSNARKDVKAAILKFAERMKEIERCRRENLEEKIRKAEKAEKARVKQLEDYTSGIISWGLWQSEAQIRVITKLPNSEQSYKGKVKTHNYINRQNQSTTGKL